MAKISIVTPTNHIRWLGEAWLSLKTQTFADFEWLILPNGDVRRDDVFAIIGLEDGRVIVAPESLAADIEPGNIGALKALACSVARGEILLEFDHDDLLMPFALEKIRDTFAANPDVGMVYSNCCRVNEDLSPNVFGQGYGWEYRTARAFWFSVIETVSPAPVPQNLSRIWYAPDHLRAWRASEYRRVGGHDAALKVADDHDLCCRFYLDSKIYHIDEPLYLYRIHGENNWLERNDEVQVAQWRNYEKYIQPMAAKWSNDQGLRTLDLTGCGEPPWSFVESDSVGLLLARNGLQHLSDQIAAMNEAHRILAHGGFLLIEVPSTDGRGAFCDPTVKSYWNELSFRYWTEAQAQAYIPSAQGGFQSLRMRTYFPDAWHLQNNIPITQAHLIALKNGVRFHGAIGF